MTAGARGTVLAAVGVAGVALAVLAVAGLVPETVTDAVTVVDATVATGALGAGLLGYAYTRRRRTTDSGGPGLASSRSDGGTSDAGERFDRELLRASVDANEPAVQDARQTTRERVRATAVRAYARRRGVSRDDARDAVATGAWTDDVVAAAFVGDDRAPAFPLGERLRGWVRPERAHRRRAERAIQAVHELATEGSR